MSHGLLQGMTHLTHNVGLTNQFQTDRGVPGNLHHIFRRKRLGVRVYIALGFVVEAAHTVGLKYLLTSI